MLEQNKLISGQIIQGQVGAYHIIEKVGDGAQGIVYKAVAADGTLFAVKDLFLRTLEEREDVTKHIQNLQRLPADVCGVRLANLIDLEEKIESIRLIQPFLAGTNLREQKPLPKTVAVDLVARVARAMHEIHSEYNLHHRDLKPSSIMWDGETVSICDFGIARAATDYTGTLARGGVHAAPEQGYGEIKLPIAASCGVSN